MATNKISPTTTQEQQKKALGGMPPTKTFKEITKVNTPGARKPAPDSFRPRR